MGYWEEKRKYEDLKHTIQECTFCGKQGKMLASCQYSSFMGLNPCGKRRSQIVKEGIEFEIINQLCRECAKKCKKCSKFYCPDHIKKHKCKA